VITRDGELVWQSHEGKAYRGAAEPRRGSLDHLERMVRRRPVDVPEEKIHDVILRLGGGRIGQRVRIADLRDAFPGLDRTAIDAALKSMQATGQLVLMRLENPVEITPRDEAAVLMIAGNPRHIVYLQERQHGRLALEASKQREYEVVSGDRPI